MALNPNHTFEDLEDIKCSIVEKNCTPERVDFLKKLLEHNKFEVVVAKSPPPKAAKPAPAPKPAAPPADGAEPSAAAPAAPVVEAPAPPPPPDTYTVGVTNLTFSPINAIFNRELVAPDGKVVTREYWKQQEVVAKEEEWYWRR